MTPIYAHSIAVDSSGNPHVAFIYQTGGYCLPYYIYGTTSWQSPISLADTTTVNHRYPTVEMDSNDVVHYAWSEYYSNNYRRVYHKSASSPYTSFSSSELIVEVGTDPILNLSMAADDQGNVYLICENDAQSNICGAYYNGSTWTEYEAIDTLGWDKPMVGGRLGKSGVGQVIISPANTADPDDLYYWIWDGSVWLQPETDVTEDTDSFVSLEKTVPGTAGDIGYLHFDAGATTGDIFFSRIQLDPNQPPDEPATPYSNDTTAQSGQTNPTGIIDPSPAFSAVFNDPDSGDIANKYRVQVNTASDFNGTMMWDSGESGTSMTNTTAGNRCPDIIYAGSVLASDTTYYWRIKFWDDEGEEGAWNSTAQSFQTATIPAACDIAFRSASPAVTATSGGVSVAMPAGTVEDDIMIFAATSWGDVALSFPAGWTKFHESFDHNVRVTLAWKRAVAGESGPYAVTRAGGGKIIAAIASFSGAITFGSPIDVGPEHQHTSGGATTTAPSITTTVEGAMVVMTSHVDNDRTHSGWGCATDPSSLTEGFDYDDSDVVSVALAYARQSSTGSTGNGTATLSSAEDNDGVLFALKPNLDGCSEVLIESSAQTAFEYFQGTGAAVVFVSDLVGYAFYLESAVPTAQLKYAKTTDGGATWPTEVSVDDQTDVVGFAIWYDQWTPGDFSGTKIHIAFLDNTDDDLFYDFLDTSDDSQHTGGVVTIASVGSVGTNDGKPSITKSTDGDLYVFAAGSTREVWRSTAASGGETWASTSATFLNDDLEQGNLMPLSGGDILLTYQNCPCTEGTTFNIVSRVLSNSGTWDSSDSPTIASVFWEYIDWQPMWGTSLYRATGDIYLAVDSRPASTSAANIETYLYDEGNRTWSQKAGVVTNDTNGLMDTKIAIDECTGDVYVVYTRGQGDSSGSVHFKKSTDGMASWGTEQTISDYNDDFRVVRPNLMSDERLYVVWQEDDLSDIWGRTIVDLSGSCNGCKYVYKRAITIDHTKVIGENGDTADLTNFPVLIKESGTWLRNSSYTDGRIENVNGYDIIFKDASETTILAHEIEYYNEGSEAVNGELVAWVKIPTLDYNGNTVIYMYYGNSCIENKTEDPEAVWSNGFVGVWHLHDDYNDSTSNGNHLSASGSPSYTSSKIAGGVDFDQSGANEYLSRTDADCVEIPGKSDGSGTDDFTFSLWMNVDDETARHPFMSKQSSAAGRGYVFSRETSGDGLAGYMEVYNSSFAQHSISSDSLNQDKWYYVVGIYDGVDDLTLYIADESGWLTNSPWTANQASHGGPRDNTADFLIGRYYWDSGNNYHLDGTLDEIRISNTVRSQEWTETEYNNQTSPSTFYGLGPEDDDPLNPVTMSEHTSGQIGDQFDGSASQADKTLFRFRLENKNASYVTIDQLVFHLSAVVGIEDDYPDLSDLKICWSAVSCYNLTAPSLVITGDTGTITFDDGWSMGPLFANNYYLRGDADNLVPFDTMTISMAPSDIALLSGGVGGTAPSNAKHTTDAPDPEPFLYRKPIEIDRTKIANPPTFPIAFDAVSSAETVPAGGASSLTWSHTLGSGQDRFLIVGVSIRNESSQEVDSVTYNGTPLTRKGFVNNSTYVRAELWYLPEASLPAAGTYDVVVNVSAAVRFVAGAFSLFNVDPTTPLGGFASNTGVGNPTWGADVDVASAEDEIVVATLAKRYDDPVETEMMAHQADRWNLTTHDVSANNVLGVGSLRGSEGSTETPMWFLGGSTSNQQWAIAGVSVKSTTEAAPRITTLTDYPMLYSVTDTDLRDHVANANGWDIIFRAEDDTTCGGEGLAPCSLDHEIEKYDASTGKLVAWVRLPSVNGEAASSNTVIYIYYGNSSIYEPSENKTGVWDSNYMEVWHLSESSGDASDSTANGYVAAVQSDPGEPTHPDAKIGGGYQFAGDSWLLTNDGQFTVANAPLTIEGWFHIDSGSPTWIGIATKNRDVSCDDDPPYCDWAGIWIGGSGELTYAWDWHNQGNIEGGAALSPETWYYAAITFDGGIRTGFRNGFLDTVVTSPNPSPGTYADLTMPTRMNKDLDGGGMMNGIIDEVRISTAARTPGWILTSYNNMNNPGDIGSPGFYVVGGGLKGMNTAGGSL